MRKSITAVALALGVSQAVSAFAVTVTAQDTLRGYESEARKESAAFKSSASRGESFFRNERSSAKGGKQSCASCHTSDPRQVGATRAHKAIEALAPAANAARFTDPAKVEKWFGRNCEDVLERACSAAEKADFIHWLLTIK